MEPNKEQELTSKENKSLTLLDIIIIFLKWKKYILLTTLVICIISIILYFFEFDLIYVSTASIKSSGKSLGLLSSLENVTDISGLDEFDISSGSATKDLALYQEILSSRRCIEPLITKFGLMQRDQYIFLEDAIKGFRDEQLKLRPEKLPGILYIDVYDKDPGLAKEMVDFLLEQLNRINIEMSVLNARNNREFIENRYIKAREDLEEAEDSLKAFQQIYGYAPDLQFKAAMQSAFTIEADIKTEEVKLDILKKLLNPDQLEVKTQEEKINSLKNKLAEIQSSTNVNNLIRLGNSPQIGMQYIRLQRQVEIRTKILTFLLPVFEKAKIDEKKETPTILVLDKPNIAERKTKPKRLTMVLFWTFSSFLFMVFITTAYEKAKIFGDKLKAKER